MLAELLMLGYTYEVNIVGEQTEVGIGTSKIVSFVLYDAGGVNVTEYYNIDMRPGSLKVFQNTVDIYILPLTKIYDGQEHTLPTQDFIVVAGGEGLEIVIHRFNFSLTNSGAISSMEINVAIEEMIDYSIYMDGADVTSNYSLYIVAWGGSDTESYDVLTVKPRLIEVTTNSASKEYDGKALTCNEYSISMGSLVKGHVLQMSVIGSITDEGTASNVVARDSIIFWDRDPKDPNAQDVTSNYTFYDDYGVFHLYFGTLTVT